MLAFYINLDRRTDRRAFMEHQLAEIGLPAERLPAITPDMLRDEDFASTSLHEARCELSEVEIAISLSHFAVWKRMLARGDRYVLVLEDDLRLSPLLPKFLAGFASKNVDLSVLRLETQLSRVVIARGAQPAPAGLSFHDPISFEGGAGAYIISAEHAARVLASPRRFLLPLDDMLFSPKTPVRVPSGLLKVAVPALALYQFDASAQFDVPANILVSDAHAAREQRDARQWAERPKLKGFPRLRREIRRVSRQIANLPTRMLARRMIVPFAADLSGGLIVAGSHPHPNDRKKSPSF
ncbi:MAG: glycosyltransferase family 25 protein [Rhizobiaceae bacterium]|nr:glycosyltransferase family 25 protein [Rhizobiaceae bacterium]